MITFLQSESKVMHLSRVTCKYFIRFHGYTYTEKLMYEYKSDLWFQFNNVSVPPIEMRSFEILILTS